MLERGIDRAVRHLLAAQAATGCWNAPLESDAGVTASYVLYERYLGRPDSALEADMVRYLYREQHPDGAWGRWPGSGPDLDVTVLAYAALAEAGEDQSAGALVAAARAVKRLGGLGRLRMETRVPLALLGHLPPCTLPRIPLALVRSPLLYDLSILRTALFPLSILVYEHRFRTVAPSRRLSGLGLDSVRWTLVPEGADVRLGLEGQWAWSVLSLGTACADLVQGIAGRRATAEQARNWIRRRLDDDGTMANSTTVTLLALAALRGHVASDLVERGRASLRRWVVHDERGAWQQEMPPWTAITAVVMEALRETGLPVEGAVDRAVGWLEAHEARSIGDWARRAAFSTSPGGWSFGGTTQRYPDADDTAIVLRCLDAAGRGRHPSCTRGVGWILALQGRNGGWAAWDRDNDRTPLAFMSLVSPGYADRADCGITARALEALAPLRETGFDTGGIVTQAVERGVRFLWRGRRGDGTWRGDWGVNHVWGTATAVLGLLAAGVPPADQRLARSLDWLESVANADGGWGESKCSYRTGRFEPGPSSTFVTPQVLQALVAAGRALSRPALRGFAWLAAAQQDDGSWSDGTWSGVMFAGVQYARYHLVPTGMAVKAMARALRAWEAEGL